MDAWRMRRLILATLAWIAAVASPAIVFPASPEIFLVAQPENYIVIDKLEGMGLLPGLMTSDRGLEAREVALEAEKKGDVEDPFAADMLRFLKLEGIPCMDFRLHAGPVYSRNGEVPPNLQGLPIQDGSGLRAGGFLRGAATGWLSFQARGDYVTGGDDGSFGRLEETSLRIGWPRATLEVGRFSLWWGPGRHGGLLFTTNAEPLTGVRLRNPRPIESGSWFSFLGLFQYDLFFARLEKNRPIPHSILSGIRVAIKPKPWVEIGASRAMHYGGKNRGNSPSDWWNAFKGTNENEPGNQGNQLGGFDISVLLPFRRQPIRAYLEAAGEDQARGHVIPLPSKWAFLAGAFFPSVLGSPRWDLRLEAAQNHFRDNGPSWYVHESSGGGYGHRYRGRILGHHMGTDARDLFIEAHYFILPASYLELNADKTQRTFPGFEREDTDRAGAGIVLWLTKNWRNETRITVSRVSNENGMAGADVTDLSFQMSMSYQYR